MTETDLLVIGGGINGVGIARDAAGRGLHVTLCDKGDLGGATSSATSKLIHGGLRYLEYYEFRLVRESLAEREVQLRSSPHLTRPMRFIMPHAPGLRPMWMIRIGLFLYDHLGRRRSLPDSKAVALEESGYGAGLRPDLRRGFVYSDCCTDDARLVLANARAAAELGARVLPRTRFDGASLEQHGWQATLTDTATDRSSQIRAKGLVNAGGPWVDRVLGTIGQTAQKKQIHLVKGSHIVVPKLHDGDHALILQNDDKRVVFVIPYQGEYSVIGTTDVPIDTTPDDVGISEGEIEYLCSAVNRYLAAPVDPGKIVWTYSGVRPLFDEGEADPSKMSRDYELEVQAPDDRYPLLSVYGGKLTTYRRLAEQALEKLEDFFPQMAPPWTATAPLPGGDIPGGDFDALLAALSKTYDFIPEPHLRRLAHRHGSRCADVLGDAQSLDDLGTHFGNGLYAREVDYLREQEWAQTTEDILWRRTKCGLGADPDINDRLEEYLAADVRSPHIPSGRTSAGT